MYPVDKGGCCRMVRYRVAVCHADCWPGRCSGWLCWCLEWCIVCMQRVLSPLCCIVVSTWGIGVASMWHTCSWVLRAITCAVLLHLTHCLYRNLLFSVTEIFHTALAVQKNLLIESLSTINNFLTLNLFQFRYLDRVFETHVLSLFSASCEVRAS